MILSTKRPLSDGPTYPKRVGLSVTIHSPLNHRARSRLHVAGTPNAPPRTHAPECPQPRARKPGRRAPRGLASQESLLNSLSCNELQTRTLQIMRETPVPVAVLPWCLYRKKTPGGAGTHTRDTRAHTSTRITQKNLTTIQKTGTGIVLSLSLSLSLSTVLYSTGCLFLRLLSRSRGFRAGLSRWVSV